MYDRTQCQCEKIVADPLQPIMHQPDLYQEACDAIFAGTVISQDGQHMDLSYDNRETGDV